MNWRDVTVGVAAAVLATAELSLPTLDALDGISIDTLFWLRHHTIGPRHDPADSPTAIIAIDEETYRREPFEQIPKAMWTPQLAAVMQAALDGGATQIAQDVILPTSVEGYLRGFDREYLQFSSKAAKAGKLLLAKVQHTRLPISPFPGYSYAVGHDRNIRLANLLSDPDGIIRRVPLKFGTRDPAGEGRSDFSIALELAARAAGAPPVFEADGTVRVDGYEIPGSADNAMLIDFDTGGRDIPVYSLADLLACHEAGDTAYFEQAFGGRIVLVGAVLDVEDRKTTSLRFATAQEGAWFAPRCKLPVMASLYDGAATRDTVPGVFVHAAAVNNLLRHDALRELGHVPAVAVCLVLALLVALVAFRLPPDLAWLSLGLGVVVWITTASAAFAHGLVLPLVDPILASVITMTLLAGFRFAVTDREKRQIRKAFAYYLPGPEIDRMLRTGPAPELGGETRELTVMFSDLEGFTTLSESLPPEEIVSIMNRYLTVMTEIIERHHGFVDKFIGDGIVAVFGAPISDPDHASHAVEAALESQAFLREHADEIDAARPERIRSRMGVNSGPILIGNIGSERRFNYTVMGDPVNLAARLEPTSKRYGTRILVSDSTVALCGERLRFRKIDRVRVRGRRDPVTIYEPYGETDFDAAHLAAFEAARTAYERRDFAAARDGFAALAAHDPVAEEYAKRAAGLAEHPPSPDWDGVNDLA